MLHGSTGEDPRKLAAGALFPFVDCARHPFAAGNNNHEHNDPVNHDSHSSSSGATMLPYFSYQSNSGPHPTSSKADICTRHF